MTDQLKNADATNDKVVEFYVPLSFRQSVRRIPPDQRGKLIQFCPTEKKTA